MRWMFDFARSHKSKRLAEGEQRDLYRLHDGSLFWLDGGRYLDRCLIEEGVFEPASTKWVQRLVYPGNSVLDVGANLGYYSVLLAAQVGTAGRVTAFEPTAYYRDVLMRNLQANELAGRVHIIPYGLSSETASFEIGFGECSATLHWVEDQPPVRQERIELYALDEIWPSLGLNSLDFIKADIDGHEPAFLQGAERTLSRYRPILLLEVNHANYLAAGWTAWDFYEYLRGKGWRLFSESSGREYVSRMAFLRECGNFDRSANILVATGSGAAERLERLGMTR